MEVIPKNQGKLFILLLSKIKLIYIKSAKVSLAFRISSFYNIASIEKINLKN